MLLGVIAKREKWHSFGNHHHTWPQDEDIAASPDLGHLLSSHTCAFPQQVNVLLQEGSKVWQSFSSLQHIQCCAEFCHTK